MPRLGMGAARLFGCCLEPSQLIRKFKRFLSVSRLLASPRRSGRYVGVLGIENLGDEAVYSAIRGYFQPVPMLWCSLPVRPRWLNRLVTCRRQDLLVLGGGTLIGGGTRDGNPCLDAFEEYWGNARYRLVFTTGVSSVDFERDDPALARRLSRWKRLLGQADFVGVRGPDSQASVERWGIKAEVIGDAACHFVRDEDFWAPRNKLLGINVGRSGRDYPELEEAAAAFLRRRIDEGWHVEFFVVWPPDLESTLRTARLARIADPVIHKHYFSAEAYQQAVRRVVALIAIKLHAGILSLVAGVPTILLDYNPKCRDFMRSVNLLDLNLPLSEATSDNIELYCEKAISLGTDRRVDLLAIARQYRNRQMEVARYWRDKL